MIRKARALSGELSGSIEDIILFGNLYNTSPSLMNIYRGINSNKYDSKVPGNYWTENKKYAMHYVGSQGFLLTAQIPSDAKNTNWYKAESVYNFPDRIVKRFNITAEKIVNPQFF